MPRAFSAYTNTKVVIGPVTNENAKVSTVSSHSRGRCSGRSRPTTHSARRPPTVGGGTAAAGSVVTAVPSAEPERRRWKRSGSLSLGAISGVTASGTRASANSPRKPSWSPKTPRSRAVRPAPMPKPAVIRAIALTRSWLVVSSAAITPATVLVADSSGRPRAKIATNHQKVGLTAAVAVRARPTATQPSSVSFRPKRSASPASGRLPSEASRMTASPTPRVAPDRPTLAAIEVPPWSVPNVLATSPSAAVAPNWAKPAASVNHPAARMAGWRQPYRRTGRGSGFRMVTRRANHVRRGTASAVPGGAVVGPGALGGLVGVAGSGNGAWGGWAGGGSPRPLRLRPQISRSEGTPARPYHGHQPHGGHDLPQAAGLPGSTSTIRRQGPLQAYRSGTGKVASRSLAITERSRPVPRSRATSARCRA